MAISSVKINNSIGKKGAVPTSPIRGINSNVNNRISFGIKTPARAYNKVTDGLAFLLGKFANTNFVKKSVEFINGNSKSKVLSVIGKKLDIKNKWFQHAIAAEAIYLTGFYMYNTKKSKSIPEHQKRPMMVNQALVSTLCTTLGYVVDNKISKAFNGMKNLFLLTNAKPIAEKMSGKVVEAVKMAKDTGAVEAAYKMPLKRLNGIASGISKLKSVLVFGFIYRYFSPVFVTPIANKVSELMDKKLGSKYVDPCASKGITK